MHQPGAPLHSLQHTALMSGVVSGLGQGVGTLSLEIAGLVVAIVVIARLLPNVGVVTGAPVIATGLVVGVLAVAVIAEDLASSVTAIAQAQPNVGNTRDGIDHCFEEQGAGSLIPFLKWLGPRVPPHTTYTTTIASAVDGWCVALALLPRLPAFGGPPPGWWIAFGSIPPSMQALLDRHDPSVTLYAPGMAIQRLSRHG